MVALELAIALHITDCSVWFVGYLVLFFHSLIHLQKLLLSSVHRNLLQYWLVLLSYAEYLLVTAVYSEIGTLLDHFRLLHLCVSCLLSLAQCCQVLTLIRLDYLSVKFLQSPGQQNDLVSVFVNFSHWVALKFNFLQTAKGHQDWSQAVIKV